MQKSETIQDIDKEKHKKQQKKVVVFLPFLKRWLFLHSFLTKLHRNILKNCAIYM